MSLPSPRPVQYSKVEEKLRVHSYPRLRHRMGEGRVGLQRTISQQMESILSKLTVKGYGNMLMSKGHLAGLELCLKTSKKHFKIWHAENVLDQCFNHANFIFFYSTIRGAILHCHSSRASLW